MAHFDTDEWRAEVEINQILVREMKFFYAELYGGSDASMLIGNNTRSVRPIRQETFLPIKGIKSHSQFVCVNKGIVGVSYFP